MKPELADLAATEKADWQSVCCGKHALGEVSHEWWEIMPGGESKLLRQGLCAGCNETAHFVRDT